MDFCVTALVLRFIASVHVGVCVWSKVSPSCWDDVTFRLYRCLLWMGDFALSRSCVCVCAHTVHTRVCECMQAFTSILCEQLLLSHCFHVCGEWRPGWHKPAELAIGCVHGALLREVVCDYVVQLNDLLKYTAYYSWEYWWYSDCKAKIKIGIWWLFGSDIQ